MTQTSDATFIRYLQMGLLALLTGALIAFTSATPVKADPGAGALTGLVGGALIGGAIKGKKGAIVGGAVGAAVGAAIGEEERKRKARSKASKKKYKASTKPSYTPSRSTSSETYEYGLVLETQKLLVEHGFDPGPVDGIYGPQTELAISEYQEENKLLVDGTPSEPLVDHMLANEG